MFLKLIGLKTYLFNKTDVSGSIIVDRKSLQQYHIYSQTFPMFTHIGSFEA